MSITYRKKNLLYQLTPEGIKVSLPEGGKILIDEWLFDLWQRANLKGLNQLLNEWKDREDNPDVLRTALCCLVETGLLEREPHSENNSHKTSQSLSSQFQGPLVSIIIVAHQGKKWLTNLLPSVLNQTYTPIEIIVVDNGPQEDHLSLWITENYPEVITIVPEKRLSFAAANNLAVDSARGQYLFLLNQDTLLEQDAIAQAVQILQKDPQIAAVALKLRLLWARSFLNGLGNCVENKSWGHDVGFGQLDLGQFDQIEEVNSACFAAALISRKAWDHIGPLDERFPMYYEDSEWCYRARLMGYRIAAAPKAIVFHAFGGSPSEKETPSLSHKKLTYVCYGRLRFATKLIEFPYLMNFLVNYLKEDLNGAVRAIIKARWKMFFAYLCAWLKYCTNLPEMLRHRKRLQEQFILSSQLIFQEKQCEKIETSKDGIPILNQRLISDYYCNLITSRRTRPMVEFLPPHREPSLLIVSNDIIDVKMAGPGMRYAEMARALSQDLQVTLAIPNSTTFTIPNVRIVTYREQIPESLQVLVDNHDFTLISGYMIKKFPFLKRTRTSLIVDLYDPFLLENLYYYSEIPVNEQIELNRQSISVINELARVGDYFICGHERQRDLWIGLLIANGRINPLTYKEDDTLRNLIDIVGIGLPDREPKRRPFLRGIHPQFNQNSKIVLWGGGIWNWLDPLPLIRVWPTILKELPQSRLVFLGTRHPNPSVPEHKMAFETIELAKQIGEKDKSIFFIEWVNYEEREYLLCEADVGVILHPYHLETRYSIRTRIMDYFWCRLPVIITEGDISSEWVKHYNVGRTVLPADERSLVEALLEVLTTPRDKWHHGFDEIHKQMNWKVQVEPLRKFCLTRKYAADRNENREAREEKYIWVPEPQSKIKEALLIYATQGWKALLKKVIIHLRWLFLREG